MQRLLEDNVILSVAKDLYPQEAEMELEARLIEILKGIDPDINIDVLTRETNLKEELGLSSIGLLYMAVAIEDEFHINLGNENLGQIKTVGDVIDVIQANV